MSTYKFTQDKMKAFTEAQAAWDDDITSMTFVRETARAIMHARSTGQHIIGWNSHPILSFSPGRIPGGLEQVRSFMNALKFVNNFIKTGEQPVFTQRFLNWDNEYCVEEVRNAADYYTTARSNLKSNDFAFAPHIHVVAKALGLGFDDDGIHWLSEHHEEKPLEEAYSEYADFEEKMGCGGYVRNSSA